MDDPPPTYPIFALFWARIRFYGQGRIVGQGRQQGMEMKLVILHETG